MSEIKHARGNVTLRRRGSRDDVDWTFRIDGQTSASSQELIINDAATLDDLKQLIGQVEHAAKVLALDSD